MQLYAIQNIICVHQGMWHVNRIRNISFNTYVVSVPVLRTQAIESQLQIHIYVFIKAIQSNSKISCLFLIHINFVCYILSIKAVYTRLQTIEQTHCLEPAQLSLLY
ncbi:Hypothetical_protein [Hexamita inflata]|uniref:Hypothetical_protein n=1 Tax=Hexamita inflata TaxID=28002 RepID=A0AA86PLP0_9EUKA|nr:Hypothetical protein HINF_LOCUS28483 [Hexamita inflata]CAI9940843.1 Hypothetical protein HINF_LOCUS28488 [Hexamita inflata]